MLRWIAATALVAVAGTANADLAGLVIGIADGDTLTLLRDQKQIKVRLAEIDAPERKQPFGTRSRESLAELCFRRAAKLKALDTDRYGRTVARVYCDGIDANAEQVRRGMAWVYDRYVTDTSLYGIQDAARGQRAGLWSQPSPVPPWAWRKSRR